MEEAKKIILIVEDEPSLLNVLEEKFTKEGFEVMRAADGQEGLDKFGQKTPDLVLLDIIMPIMNGIEMLTKMREMPKGNQIPVILLTNLTSPPEPSFRKIIGESSEYLVKSDWKLDDVVEKVKNKLAKDNLPTQK
ncbi:MAG TPA: response regulator [Patescibacteria group bacterium]|nr:response regulator [Patescibacteria group bacterium]